MTEKLAEISESEYEQIVRIILKVTGLAGQVSQHVIEMTKVLDAQQGVIDEQANLVSKLTNEVDNLRMRLVVLEAAREAHR